MKIEKKDFYKLKQLDRIEYRQRYDFIERNRPDFAPFSFIYTMLFIFAYVILLIFVVYNVSEEAARNLSNILPLIIQIGFIVFMILLTFQIATYFIFYKKIKELEKEYFNIGVKNK